MAVVLRFSKRARKRGGWVRQIALAVAGGVAIGLGWAVLPAPATPDAAIEATRAAAEGLPAVTARFAPCGSGRRVTCVVDGDTFWLAGAKIRIADIDAPEIFSPGCPAEAALGRRATRRLQALLNAGPITLVPIDRDRDRYGRQLRVVERDGVSLGAMLVREGLAHRWGGPQRRWC